jgi:hypothetical protein
MSDTKQPDAKNDVPQAPKMVKPVSGQFDKNRAKLKSMVKKDTRSKGKK